MCYVCARGPHRCSYAIFTAEWWEYVKAGYWEYPQYDDVRREHTHCKNKILIPLRIEQSVSIQVAMPVRKEIRARQNMPDHCMLMRCDDRALACTAQRSTDLCTSLRPVASSGLVLSLY